MRNYTYQFEIERLVTMFIAAMDDIVVKRYNVHKNSRDHIRVRFVYAPKQRVLHDLLDKAQNMQLPVAAVSIGGVSRDPGRVFNKIAGSTYANSTSKYNNLLQPVPIDLTLNVSFLTRYQADMDQCISNFLPYCDPYFVISWRIPDMPDQEIRSHVMWSGNVSYEYPTDLNATSVARVRADTSFTLKGWLFKAPVPASQPILTIVSTLSSADLISQLYTLDNFHSADIDSYNATRFTLSAVPQPLAIDTLTTQTSAAKSIILSGRTFIDVTNVYLSGTPYIDQSMVVAPFTNSVKLSSTYGSMFCVKLSTSQYTVVNDNTIMLLVPPANYPGLVDIIVENPAGYGTLVNNVRHNTYNPYPVGTAEWVTYVPYNPKYIDGLRVVSI